MKFKSDVQLESLNNATTDTDKFLVSDGSTVKYRTGAQVLSDIGGQSALTNPITGTGTTNYLSKFTGATSLGNSQVFDNGTNVGIGTTTPDARLDIVTPSPGFNRGMKIGPQTATDGDGAYIEFTTAITDGYGPQIGGIRTGSGGLGDLVIRTGGILQAERFRVTNGGNIGIGTTSPGVKLDVVGQIKATYSSAGALVLDRTATNPSQILFRNSGVNSGYIGADSTNCFVSVDNLGNTRLVVNNSNGNVGIGTTSPGVKLHVGGASGELLRLADSSATGNPYMSFYQAGGRRSYIQHVDNGDNLTLASELGGIRFLTAADGNELERMRITSVGNVGIGTTSPGGKLHVVGDGIFDNGSGRITLGNASGQNDIYSTTTGFSAWKNLRLSSNELILSTGGTTERMRITSAGNVGVGTTAPESSAVMELKSTTQGFLPPRMKKEERDNIVSPAKGLIIYNTDEDALNVFNGGGWKTVAWA